MFSKKGLIAALVVLVVIICGAVYAGGSYHYILLDSRVKILKKAEFGFQYTFVDARGIKKAKLLLNTKLLKAGLKDLID